MNCQRLEDAAVIGMVVIGIVEFIATIVNSVKIKKMSNLIDEINSTLKN